MLDLSRILAGPFATQFFADLGADVLKIEHPQRGDDTRKWGPPFVRNDQGERGNAAYFYCANRGKSFETLDFKTTEGQTRIRTLAREADILVENYKVDVLKNYGLDYNSLKAVNPRLIYCSITGFGQTGPYRDRPGYDFVIQGMSGLMSVTGLPNAEPMRTGIATADLSASLHAVSGILAALYARTRSGKGCHIDVSLLDTQIAMLSHHASNYLNGGEVPQRIGNTHPNIVPYQVFSTRDQPLIIAVGNDAQFKALCNIIDRSELAADVRFSTNSARVTHRDALVAILQSALHAQGAGHWIERLLAEGVPAGPINDFEQVFSDPHVKARGLRILTDTDDTTGVSGVKNPIVFDD